MQALTRNEQQILENYLYQNIDLSKMGILLTLYTGLRLGELCALQWKNIDIENQMIHIDKTVQRISGSGDNMTKIIFDTPKSESSIRNIPIFTGILSLLKNTFYSSRQSENCFFNRRYIFHRTAKLLSQISNIFTRLWLASSYLPLS